MLKGHCLCGDIAYEIDGGPSWMAYCHCRSCRRQTASPVTLFFGTKTRSVRWVSEEPASYTSSPGVSRAFCSRCGTPVYYSSADRPDELDFYHGTLAEPDATRPDETNSARHVFTCDQLSWFEICDGLPRYCQTSREGAEPLRHGPERGRCPPRED